MTSPNEPGRDDAERQQRDGQDSAASTPSEEQAEAQPNAETPEQADGAEAASAERAEDTEATPAQESAEDATKTEAAAERSESATEQTESAAEQAEQTESASEQAEQTESATERTEGAAVAEEAPAAAAQADQEQTAVAGQDQASGLGEELAGDAPKKKKTGLIVGVAAAAVLVLAAAGVGAYMLFSGPSAQKVAEDYAAVSNQETQDPASVSVDDYRSLVCSKAMPQIEQIQKQKEAFLKQAKPQDLDMLKQVHTSVKNVQADGDKGKVTLEQTVPGQQAQELNLNLIKEDGWKLCA
ncbi:hypothetical protein GCM10009854_44000 [Saccharopolyspora halophila]|uniref:DUF4878 domain-containing protein n=1 Tax=Saccharopolyspora halophila TaxID=405551 RepID=A0ABN3GT76_9PSEU